jgi:hypothetical protein
MQDVARQAVRDHIERTSKRELLDRVLDDELPSLRRGARAPRAVIFLDLEVLLHVARRTRGDVEMRDVGLLESASARPRSTAVASSLDVAHNGPLGASHRSMRHVGHHGLLFGRP